MFSRANIDAHNPAIPKTRPLTCVFLLVFLAALWGCGPTLKQVQISDPAVKAEKEKQREIAFDTFIKRQKRLYKVSYPLLAAAYSMNIDDARLVCGFMVCTKDAFGKENEDVARRYFNLGDNPVIFFVHPEFPAAKVGIKPGDRLLNYNGAVLIGKSFKEIKKVLQGNKLATNKQITVVVERDGRILDFRMEGVPCLKYFMVLAPSDQINAFSDGNNIVVYNGMMRFVESDDELAFVLAHEIAHNVLGHIRKKTGNVVLGSILDLLILGTTGVSTGGMFGRLGSAAHSQGFEFEADYAGLYIAARAGHDVSGAVNFWRRLAAEQPRSIERGFAASHPSTPERFVAMERTIQEIKEKEKLGKPLIPESKEERSGGESGWKKP
jgi:membrane-associated protease RseP (regulator of RpoE activity)